MRPSHDLFPNKTNQERLTDLFKMGWDPIRDTQALLSLNPNENNYANDALTILKRWQQAPTEATQAPSNIPGYQTLAGFAAQLPDVVKAGGIYIAAHYNALGVEEGRLDWFEYCYRQRRLFAVTQNLWSALGFTLQDLEYFLTKEPSLFVSMMDRVEWHPLLLELHKLYPTQAKSIVDKLFEFFSPTFINSPFLLSDQEEQFVKNRLTLLGQMNGPINNLDKRIFTLVDDIWKTIKATPNSARAPKMKQWSTQLMGIPSLFDQTRVDFMIFQWNALLNDQAHQLLAKDYLEQAILPYLTRFTTQLSASTRRQIVVNFYEQKQRIPLELWKTLGYTAADIEELIRTLPEFLNELMQSKTPEDRDLMNEFLRESEVFRVFVLQRCIENILATVIEAPERCRTWISLLQDVQQRVPQPQNAESYPRQILREVHRLKIVLPDDMLKQLAYDKADLIWIFLNIPSVIEGWLGNEGTMWFELLKTFSKAEIERYRGAYLTTCIREGHPISLRLWQSLNYNEQDIVWMFRHVPQFFNRLTDESASLWHDNLIMMAEQSTLNAQAIHQCLWEQWVPILPTPLDDQAIQLLARVLQTLPCNEQVLDDVMTRYFSHADRRSDTVFQQYLLPYCQTHQATLSVDFKKRWVNQFIATQQLPVADPLIAAFKLDEIEEIPAEEKYRLFQQHHEQDPTTPSKLFLSPQDVKSLMKKRVQADAPPSPEEMKEFHQMSSQSYFDLAADPDLDAVELERMNVLLPGNAFPEENEDQLLADNYVRRLLLDRKEPTDSTRRYHWPIINEYDEFREACDQAFKKRPAKTGPLKTFFLADPVKGTHWLNVMPEQTINELQELFPWLASMQKPGDEIKFDPQKLEKFRDHKTYRSYCTILNKGSPALDPQNPQVRYEKALKVYKDYRNKCYLHPRRHHVLRLHKLLKAERLLPNDAKTPEALLARVELCLAGKTINLAGSLNCRNEFIREENHIPKKNN